MPKWSRRYVLIIAGVIAGVLMACSPGSVFFIFLAAITVYFIRRGCKDPKECKFLVSLFISAFVLRIMFSLLLMGSATFSGRILNYASYPAPDYSTPYIFDDSGYYTLRGQFIGMHLSGLPLSKKVISDFVTLAYGANGFNYILAVYFAIFGWSPFTSRFINCFFGSLTVLVVYSIAKNVYGAKIARLSAVLTAFFPSIFLWSTVNLKEPLFIFLICLMLWAIVMFAKSGKMRYLCIVPLSIWLQDFVRPGYKEFIFLNIGLIFFYFIYRGVLYLYRKKHYLLIAAILICGLGFGLSQKTKINYHYDRLVHRAVVAQNGALSMGGISYKITSDEILRSGKASPVAFVSMFAKGWIHFMLEPLPWHLKSRSLLLVFGETCVIYLLIPFALLGVFFSLRHKFIESFILISYYFFVGTSVAIISANIGTMLRFRGLVIPLFLIFSSVGIIRVFFSFESSQAGRKNMEISR